MVRLEFLKSSTMAVVSENLTVISNSLAAATTTPDTNIPSVANSSEDCYDTFGSWPVASSSDVRFETWIIVLIIMSAVNVVVITCFEVFVLCKSCGSRRRHLFLGQMLLLGLFLCSALGFVFVPAPNWITCSVTRVGLGLAYVLIFATLLVKCVFLLSLHAGTYLPAAYQGLLLFFVFAVQGVTAIQGLVFQPPLAALANCTAEPASPLSCSTTPEELQLTLIYAMFLLFVVAILALKVVGLRENHREGAFIGIAVVISILIWVAWAAVATVFEEYHDMALAFGVVLTSTVVFLVMFLPKGRQLVAMGREGMFPEDRDGISSANHSVYTPSFLHLKPNSVLINKHGTLVKHPVSSDRELYVSQSGRVWRYGSSTYPQFPMPHDGVHFYPGERPVQKKPNVTFGRSPLY